MNILLYRFSYSLSKSSGSGTVATAQAVPPFLIVVANLWLLYWLDRAMGSLRAIKSTIELSAAVIYCGDHYQYR